MGAYWTFGAGSGRAFRVEWLWQHSLTVWTATRVRIANPNKANEWTQLGSYSKP
jgi:hypothetical protein